MFRHMIDVGFVDRLRGGIGIHEVLKVESSKVKASQGSVLSRSVSTGESGGVGSPVGVSVGVFSG